MLGEAREEPVEIMAGELPGKRLISLLVTLLEGQVAGEDPRAVVEGTKGVFGEPPPDGSARDLGHKTPLNRFPNHLFSAPAAQRHPASSRQLTGDGFHLHPRFGGKDRRSAGAGSILQPTQSLLVKALAPLTEFVLTFFSLS